MCHASGSIKTLTPEAPDPFAGFDGMGGMTKQKQSDGPSVSDEMKRTEGSIKGFTPSLPASIDHPDSAGFGALPPPPIPTSSFTPQQPSAAPSYPDADPTRAPDPLREQEGGNAGPVMKLTLGLPITVSEFDEGMQVGLREAIAASAGLDVSKVEILGVSEAAGAAARRLLTGIAIDLAIHLPSADTSATRMMTIHTLNQQLQRRGLPQATFINPPVIVYESGGLPPPVVSGVANANGEGMSEEQQQQQVADEARKKQEEAEKRKQQKIEEEKVEEEKDREFQAREGGPLNLAPSPGVDSIGAVHEHNNGPEDGLGMYLRECGARA